MSQVKIPAKGAGNKGAGIPEVKLDTSGWASKSAVDKVSNVGNGGEGFINFAGGESKAEKAALDKAGKKGVGFREVEMFL